MSLTFESCFDRSLKVWNHLDNLRRYINYFQSSASVSSNRNFLAFYKPTVKEVKLFWLLCLLFLARKLNFESIWYFADLIETLFERIALHELRSLPQAFLCCSQRRHKLDQISSNRKDSVYSIFIEFIKNLNSHRDLIKLQRKKLWIRKKGFPWHHELLESRKLLGAVNFLNVRGIISLGRKSLPWGSPKEKIFSPFVARRFTWLRLREGSLPIFCNCRLWKSYR